MILSMYNYYGVAHIANAFDQTFHGPIRVRIKVSKSQRVIVCYINVCNVCMYYVCIHDSLVKQTKK